jgi:hypothetical protein
MVSLDFQWTTVNSQIPLPFFPSSLLYAKLARLKTTDSPGLARTKGLDKMTPSTAPKRCGWQIQLEGEVTWLEKLDKSFSLSASATMSCTVPHISKEELRM